MSDGSTIEDDDHGDIEVDLAEDEAGISRPGNQDLNTILSPDDTTTIHAFLFDARVISRAPISDNTWNFFCTLLADIMTEAVKVRLPTSEAPQPAGRAPFDQEDARKLQKLYMCNRRQAVRLILSGESPKCAIPVDRTEQHFKES